MGGRWDQEALDFLRGLARAKARAQPDWLRASCVQGYLHRWTALAAVAAQSAFAQSLLELPIGGGVRVDGACPVSMMWWRMLGGRSPSMTAGCPSREEHAGLHRLGLLSLGLHHWRFYELLLRWPGRPDKHSAV